ncbi:MAG: hypothetical protein UW16_C0043G0009 [Microgenomates group bacterium GW2011_GWC1_44_10]|nr:MAG: hypothetical protein UW16_C0043G0009 [Microgenomates group bacterium GW2011_GWC1_44_10]
MADPEGMDCHSRPRRLRNDDGVKCHHVETGFEY